jgi:hypothetical protein
MRAILASSAFVLLASLAACGDSGSSDSFSTSRTAQSDALTSPGTAEISAGGATVSLVGGNSTGIGCTGAQFGFATGPCMVSATYPGGGRTFRFDWSYATTDTAGPGADIFGMIVDGRVVPISDPGGPQAQTGRVEIVAQDSLQLFLNCTDCTNGPATATVTSLTR